MARQLLDFGARIDNGQRAEEQLQAAVAMHNILRGHDVAYLADEVGMGKTYVALGALALFRHQDPSFRVLVIAPRENIQRKWIAELGKFVKYNVRFSDLRVKAIDEHPMRPAVSCANLIDLVRESTLDPDRDFFVRLSSFSLAVRGDKVIGRDRVDPDAARHLRNMLRRHLPWMRDEVFDLRNKREFKDNFARAICCALPVFDLVIVDEAHNLKYGFDLHSAARNRVLGLAMGRPEPGTDRRLFPNYGVRAKRVLYLSATPIEETYKHLWHQLDVFGRTKGFDELRDASLDEQQLKDVAARVLVRRVTSIVVNGEELTKNLYRREWRRGGVFVHDEPIRIDDDRQRLIVALVQKKVSELIGERFNSSFQIGMLASFESFLETTDVKQSHQAGDKQLDGETGNFDDPAQTEEPLEREGIDVAEVNRIAQRYRERFGEEMPHPKMDAVVESLASSWQNGEKALVFVRRVASVKELKRKLDERYDKWILGRLRAELPAGVQPRFEQVVVKYHEERIEAAAREASRDGVTAAGGAELADRGGADSFFAWFFRGDGPRGVISGANVQQRFIQRGTSYATFFADNHVAALMDCVPGQVEGRLSGALEVSRTALRLELRRRSSRFLSRARTHAQADRFEAVQAAAVEWLAERGGPFQERARVMWHARFSSSLQLRPATAAPDIGNWLERQTFFTELRARPALRAKLWPERAPATIHSLQDVQERELRRELLASAARLGHAFIDLYVMTIQRLGSIDLRSQESEEEEGGSVELGPIGDYLNLLAYQMATPRDERPWGAFDELADIAEHFELILDMNAPDVLSQALSQTARTFGQLLGAQQPIGGMSGQVNQTLVRQFRMPGYPLVLVTTDLLQEGEDLHTFCSAVHHYGMSWTPSSIEQRIGRIDRVRSQTERRLSVLNRPARPDELLQVYYPHLQDTVEVLQVQRVLERMTVFLRLMHEGLSPARRDERRIETDKEFVRGSHFTERSRERLKSAFPIRPRDLRGEVRDLVISPAVAKSVETRFRRLAAGPLPSVVVRWDPAGTPGILLGTAVLGTRQQPFSLLFRSVGPRLAVRCVSPVGRVLAASESGEVVAAIVARAAELGARVGAYEVEDKHSYDLTVEGDVLLADERSWDLARVGPLVRRTTEHADALEQQFLPGHDEGLAKFRDDLEAEALRGR